MALGTVAITVERVAVAAAECAAAAAAVGADVVRAECATDSRRATASATVVDCVEGSAGAGLSDARAAPAAGVNRVVAETVWDICEVLRTLIDDRLLADAFVLVDWAEVALPAGAPELPSSAWAVAIPLAIATPTPSVTAPAPSHWYGVTRRRVLGVLGMAASGDFIELTTVSDNYHVCCAGASYMGAKGKYRLLQRWTQLAANGNAFAGMSRFVRYRPQAEA
jgi:hypothetical protein